MLETLISEWQQLGLKPELSKYLANIF